jgi:hypothetical protein
MWTAALIGIASTICAFLVGFFPPSQLPKGWVPEYEIATFGIFLLLAIVPLILNFFGKKSWVAISG